MDANFTQTAAPNFTASADAEMSGNFTQTSTQTFITNTAATIDANFTQTSGGVRVLYGLQDLNDNFILVDALGGALFSAESVMSTEFDLTDTLGGILFITGSSMDSSFLTDMAGSILWEQINAGGTVEIWTPVTHSGDTWTQINASGTIEQWNQKVV